MQRNMPLLPIRNIWKQMGIVQAMAICRYSAVADENGIVTIVPEPSTYAAILGAVALAFAAYRRRK